MNFWDVGVFESGSLLNEAHHLRKFVCTDGCTRGLGMAHLDLRGNSKRSLMVGLQLRAAVYVFYALCTAAQRRWFRATDGNFIEAQHKGVER